LWVCGLGGRRENPRFAKARWKQQRSERVPLSKKYEESVIS